MKHVFLNQLTSEQKTNWSSCVTAKYFTFYINKWSSCCTAKYFTFYIPNVYYECGERTKFLLLIPIYFDMFKENRTDLKSIKKRLIN